jgi:hypothetical protein
MIFRSTPTGRMADFCSLPRVTLRSTLGYYHVAPPGLKPSSFWASCGTAEAVPWLQSLENQKLLFLLSIESECDQLWFIG